MKKIVLASGSPRRKELLSILGLDFDICPSRFHEDNINNPVPEEFVLEAAREKGREVGARKKGLIVAADTVVCWEKEILGKPVDEEDALKMLEKLAGTTHRVLTGVAIWDPPTGKEAVKYEETLVCFRPAKRNELLGYIATGEPMDKAGAYAIQGRGSVFVSGIRGCYFNVVGLPLFLLSQMLASFGVDIFSKEEANGREGKFSTDY